MDRAIGHKLAKGRPSANIYRPAMRWIAGKSLSLNRKTTYAVIWHESAGAGTTVFYPEDKGDYRTIDVRAFWHPHGMPWLFYWLLMIPAHLFIFRGMAKRIARLAEQSTD